MARRAATRLAIDLGFAAAIVVTAAVALAGDEPPAIPRGVCAGDGRPRYEELTADDRISIAALFGQIEPGPVERDFGSQSYRMLEDALAARGFLRVAPDRYERAEGGVAIDVTLTGPAALPLADPSATSAALAAALAGHDIVYYNGHEFDGGLELAAPAAAYRIVVLDSCWSTQRYSHRLIGPTIDVIGNTERAVTGSVESFVALLDALHARVPAWSAILDPMNRLAEARATARTMRSRWKRPERYRLDVACP